MIPNFRDAAAEAAAIELQEPVSSKTTVKKKKKVDKEDKENKTGEEQPEVPDVETEETPGESAGAEEAAAARGGMGQALSDNDSASEWWHGDNNSDGWSFQSTFDFFCEKATNTKKGGDLEMMAEKLQVAEAESIPQSVLQSRNEEQNDKFETVLARETTCALLKSMLVDTKVSAIESETTFWQINWCRVHLPDCEAEIANNDNSRLWRLVTVGDETGQVKVCMRD